MLLGAFFQAGGADCWLPELAKLKKAEQECSSLPHLGACDMINSHEPGQNQYIIVYQGIL